MITRYDTIEVCGYYSNDFFANIGLVSLREIAEISEMKQSVFSAGATSGCRNISWPPCLALKHCFFVQIFYLSIVLAITIIIIIILYYILNIIWQATANFDFVLVSLFEKKRHHHLSFHQASYDNLIFSLRYQRQNLPAMALYFRFQLLFFLSDVVDCLQNWQLES